VSFTTNWLNVFNSAPRSPDFIVSIFTNHLPHGGKVATLARPRHAMNTGHMSKRFPIIFAYDIANGATRRRLREAVRAFGLSSQKSVHECRLSARELAELKARVRGLINHRHDSVLFVRLDPRAPRHALGRGGEEPNADTLYIG